MNTFRIIPYVVGAIFGTILLLSVVFSLPASIEETIEQKSVPPCQKIIKEGLDLLTEIRIHSEIPSTDIKNQESYEKRLSELTTKLLHTIQNTHDLHCNSNENNWMTPELAKKITDKMNNES